MLGMFDDAQLFNANISGWDTANTGDMRFMFRGATSFHQSLCWNTNLTRENLEGFSANSSALLLPFPACKKL
jgi:surface protein